MSPFHAPLLNSVLLSHPRSKISGSATDVVLGKFPNGPMYLLFQPYLSRICFLIESVAIYVWYGIYTTAVDRKRKVIQSIEKQKMNIIICYGNRRLVWGKIVQCAIYLQNLIPWNFQSKYIHTIKIKHFPGPGHSLSYAF